MQVGEHVEVPAQAAGPGTTCHAQPVPLPLPLSHT